MTLQINTSTGARDLTTNEQAEARAGLGAAAAADLSAHSSSTSNPHSVTKAQVGLGSVDNTADADKPVSTAQAAAIGAAVTAHIEATDPHPGKYAPADHTHTPASIGAATAAQGSTADAALQPGAQLTQAAVTAATAPGVALLGASTAAAQRTALGLGTAATTAASDYATAAQGGKADAALVASADAIADVLEAAATGAPADLARIQSSVSGYKRTSGAWGIRPASAAAGDEYFATDLGTAGVLFRWSASLGLWRLANDCLLYVRDTAVVGTTGGAVQVLAQAPIPAGLLTSVARWSFQHVLSKSGTTDACTNVSIRLGTAGASPDALIVTLANPMAAANRSFASETMLRRITNTSVASAGNGTQLTSFSGGGSGGAISAGIDVADMSTTALVISLSVTMAGTSDTPISHLVYLQGFAA